jgi:ergothioneine biosynthesis protein EgtB
MADVSPTKWHLAHASWFFENFVLVPNVEDYELFHPEFGYLFNSYYEAVGPRQARPQRGMLTRPTLGEVLEYRQHVDDAMRVLLGRPIDRATAERIELGLHHEQQHQELILTDIKHVLGSQPLEPAVATSAATIGTMAPSDADWLPHEGGLREIGHAGGEFAFDNESPRHEVRLEPFELRSRPVTNAEFADFVADGGYERAELWLSDGWARVGEECLRTPLYWSYDDGAWTEYTLRGRRPIRGADPVCHVSYYEADAYARWAGARLPTEQEWEIGAGDFAAVRESAGMVWEWTSSAYAPYPGYAPMTGALGEYNGKFMCNQMVLRGGSCATPEGHMRWTYRNFFYPASRWQFAGLRLAR